MMTSKERFYVPFSIAKRAAVWGTGRFESAMSVRGEPCPLHFKSSFNQLPVAYKLPEGAAGGVWEIQVRILYRQ